MIARLNLAPSTRGVRVERFVDDAPRVVDQNERQVVAVPDARALAAEPDQSRVALEREAFDSPFVRPRL